MQDHLFDPYGDEREADARRRRGRITAAQAEQTVLDVVLRNGGEVAGDDLLRASLDAGLDSEAVNHAVYVLQRQNRITTDGRLIHLAS